MPGQPGEPGPPGHPTHSGSPGVSSTGNSSLVLKEQCVWFEKDWTELVYGPRLRPDSCDIINDQMHDLFFASPAGSDVSNGLRV